MKKIVTCSNILKFLKIKIIKYDSKFLDRKERIVPKNRNGIEVLDDYKDIYDIFMQNSSEAENGSEEDRYLPEDKSIKRIKIDKNGVPFLDNAGLLSKIFSDGAESEKYVTFKKESGQDIGIDEDDNIKDISNENREEDENFIELIEEALKGKNRDSMMREKSDRPLPEPVPLKKRLKRYPPPEDEIDLHGYNAKEAESKTEAYLRNCWRDGLFTVQIIVGRGVHSPYGAVLPDVVEELMIRLKREGVLLWFEWDRRTKSQSGAIIAYLKQF